VALGYPAPALDFSVTPGSILSFQLEGGDREAIRTDGAPGKGNSGGPALDRTGAVAGVVTQMADNAGAVLHRMTRSSWAKRRQCTMVPGRNREHAPAC
jgi:S1-C subfamily serine protease